MEGSVSQLKSILIQEITEFNFKRWLKRLGLIPRRASGGTEDDLTNGMTLPAAQGSYRH
jgi:hypothetical protein